MNNDRLISLNAAIDALDEQIRQCDKALSAFDISMKDEYAVKVERASLVAFKETLEYMPSAQPGWIPCSAQLPKLGIRYNVTYESGEVGYADFRNKVFNGLEWVENVWIIPDYYNEDGEVVAWMPFPERWKGRQDEQSD